MERRREELLVAKTHFWCVRPYYAVPVLEIDWGFVKRLRKDNYFYYIFQLQLRMPRTNFQQLLCFSV